MAQEHEDSIHHLIENVTENMMRRIYEDHDPMSEDEMMDAWCQIQEEEIYCTVSSTYKGRTRKLVEEYGLMKAISKYYSSSTLPSLQTEEEQDSFYSCLLSDILHEQCDVTWDSYWAFRESL